MTTSDEAVTSAVRFTKNTTGYAFANVVAKRTYHVGAEGQLSPAEEQLVLVDELVYYPDDGPVQWEPDAMACVSDGTDVIVQGSAFSPAGPVRSLEVSVAVQRSGGTLADAEKRARKLLVLGDRRLLAHRDGSVAFSDPAPFETMPITYDRAYGGNDAIADQTHPDELAIDFAKECGVAAAPLSTNTYPRNAKGRGYVVHASAEALAALALPNLEYPSDRLTPERLVVGGTRKWTSAPLPAGFDWYGHDDFPRLAFLGACPAFEGNASEIPEVQNGYLTEELVTGGFNDCLRSELAPRWFRGASPWLMFPEFDGTEVLHVTHMHPTRAKMSVPLPAERPRMVLELHGQSKKELVPAIRRVVLQPDKERLVVVFVGTTPIEHMPSPEWIKKARHAVQWTS